MTFPIAILFMGIIYVLIFGFGIYVMILGIKLMKRGIVALDYYIADNQNGNTLKYQTPYDQEQ